MAADTRRLWLIRSASPWDPRTGEAGSCDASRMENTAQKRLRHGGFGCGEIEECRGIEPGVVFVR
jgi:hypothetical protein